MIKPNLKYKIEYVKPSVTTDSFILCNNKILLIKRKNNPYKDYFALPGGFLNPNEDAKRGAIRELQEETGLQLDLKFLFPVTTPHRDPRGWTITLCFGCKISNKLNLKAGDDALKAFWADYIVEENQDFIVIKLFLGQDRAEAVLKVVRDNYGDMDFEKTEICSLDKIAFDHAKIIYEALNKLQAI